MSRRPRTESVGHRGSSASRASARAPRRGAPSGRRAALSVLEAIDRGRGNSNALLADLPDDFEERERALATEIVYGVLRRRLDLDRLIGAASSRPLEEIDDILRQVLRVGAYQILFLDRMPRPAAVDETVQMARERSGRAGAAFANGVLRQCCRLIERGDPAARRPGAASADSTSAPTANALAERHSFPLFLVERYLDRFGPTECESLLGAMNRPAATALRPTRRSGGAAELAGRLEREGVIVAPSPIVRGALRVVRGVPQRSAAFREGMFYIQDEASQLVARLLLPAEGRVLDLCAAPGGKALQLADEAGAPVVVVAADRSLRKLDLLKQNAARLRIETLRPVAMDAARPALRGRFHRILLDAPCSGTGVIRRHPEIRWRRKPADFLRFGRSQDAMLRAAAALLAPGGRLVYAVCSLEPEEGPEPVLRLLAEDPGLRRIDVGTLLEEPLRGLSDEGGFLTTMPHRHDVDGFFAAVLQRDDEGGALAPSDRCVTIRPR